MQSLSRSSVLFHISSSLLVCKQLTSYTLLVAMEIKSVNPWTGTLTLLDRKGAESARADFNLRELTCYLSNTYETLPLLLKFIEEQDSGKTFCQGYKLLPWQPDF